MICTLLGRYSRCVSTALEFSNYLIELEEQLSDPPR